jgi:hypothetical protein
VGDLDLDGLTLVALVVLPRTLDELAGHEDPHAFLQCGQPPGSSLGTASDLMACPSGVLRPEP